MTLRIKYPVSVDLPRLNTFKDLIPVKCMFDEDTKKERYGISVQHFVQDSNIMLQGRCNTLNQTNTELQEVTKTKGKTRSPILIFGCVEEYLAAEDHGNVVACATKSATANENTVLFSEVIDTRRAIATKVTAISIIMQ